jgi:hypothetical protein
MTDALNAGGAYSMTFFCQVEKRTSKDKKVFPALFQSVTKDPVNLLANDMWPGYGFWDADDPTKYEPMQPEGEASKNRYSIIKRNVSLVVYGNMDKLIHTKGTVNLDYRYFKQSIQDEIIGILSRQMKLMNGTFNIQSVYQNKIEDVFKGYTLNESDGQYLQYPMFAFRFEGELTVKEQCNESSTTPVTINAGTKKCFPPVSTDQVFTSLVPAGMMLLYAEITSDKACQVSLGTSSGGTEVVQSLPIIAGLNTLTIESVYDLFNATSVYLNHAGAGDTFNGAILNVCFIYRSI